MKKKTAPRYNRLPLVIACAALIFNTASAQWQDRTKSDTISNMPNREWTVEDIITV